MAQSNVTYAGDGTTTNFTFSFLYIDKTHIHVLVNGVDTAFTWISSSTVQVSPAPALAAIVTITRQTPRSAPIVIFQNQTVDDAESYNLVALQAVYSNQEIEDALSASEDALTQVNIDLASSASQLTAAVAAKVAAQAAQTAATASQTAAAASQSAAATSASGAASSASTASTQATNAASSASAASTSASGASTSATTATTQATNAASSASASATSAAASLAAQVICQGIAASGVVPNDTLTTAQFTPTLRNQFLGAYTDLSVKEYGAVGDGTTDDLTAFTNAEAAAFSAKCAMLVPRGNFRLSANFTFRVPVKFTGVLKLDSGKSVELTRQDRLTLDDFLKAYANGTTEWLSLFPSPTVQTRAFQEACRHLGTYAWYSGLDGGGRLINVNAPASLLRSADSTSYKPKWLRNVVLLADAGFTSGYTENPLIIVDNGAGVTAGTRIDDFHFEGVAGLCQGVSSGVLMIPPTYNLIFSRCYFSGIKSYGFKESSIGSGGGNRYEMNIVSASQSSILPDNRGGTVGFIVNQGDAKLLGNYVTYTQIGVDASQGSSYIIVGNHFYLGVESGPVPYGPANGTNTSDYAKLIILKDRSSAQITGNYLDNGYIWIRDGSNTDWGYCNISANLFTVNANVGTDFPYLKFEGNGSATKNVSNFRFQNNWLRCTATVMPLNPFQIGGLGVALGTGGNVMCIKDNMFAFGIQRQASEFTTFVTTVAGTLTYTVDTTGKFPFQSTLAMRLFSVRTSQVMWASGQTTQPPAWWVYKTGNQQLTIKFAADPGAGAILALTLGCTNNDGF